MIIVIIQISSDFFQQVQVPLSVGRFCYRPAKATLTAAKRTPEAAGMAATWPNPLVQVAIPVEK